MKVKDLIQELQNFAAQDLKGGDMEVILFDRSENRELVADPDSETWEFDVTRGDGEVVFEFN